MFKAPVVLFCRNNGWAISVPTERQTASAGFAEKGVAYGIPGVRVDGNDIFAVIQVTREAVARAARGEGPTLIEALTYRLSGHSTSDDPKAYRPEAGLEPWRRLDPLLRLRRWLDRHAGWSDAKDREIEAAVDAEIRECVAVSEKTPPPPLDSMFDDVFAELPWHLVEQRDAEEDVGKVNGVFRVTQGLIDEFGDERVIDTPLSENGIIGSAIGMALNGLRPVPRFSLPTSSIPRSTRS